MYPCRHRFTTYEEVEHEGLMVLKRDGRREEFSREKLLSGIKKACQKRPVSPQTMEDMVDHIVAAVTEKFESEVPANSSANGHGRTAEHWMKSPMCGLPASIAGFRKPPISFRK
jgi:transcriptional regulator NrdR family protein